MTAPREQGLETDMTNHPNRSRVRYFKVSPRGFANEIVYFRVRDDEVEQVDKQFERFEDRAGGGNCGWTDDDRARMPGVAVDWVDRAHVGF